MQVKMAVSNWASRKMRRASFSDQKETAGSLGSMSILFTQNGKNTVFYLKREYTKLQVHYGIIANTMPIKAEA